MMVTWGRPTFLSVMLSRYMSSMPSWMNFSCIGEVLVFHPLPECFVELSFDGRDLGAGAVGWKGGGSTWEEGIGEGWSVDGCGSGVFCCSENGSHLPVGATAKGAWYHCEVSFHCLFYIVECYIVGSSSVFYDFVGKGIQEIINFVD